jgi:hypothetical protein
MSDTGGSVEVADYGAALADGIEAALPGWVERQVAETLAAWAAAGGERDQPATMAPAAGLPEQAVALLAGGAPEEEVAVASGPGDRQVAAQARAAGRRAAADVGPRVRELLARDIDDQPTTPLAIVRGAAVRYPTEVLKGAGVPPVVRDAAAQELFPDDLYDLAPAAFGDLDPDLADVGLRWGAAKAFEHMRRHGGSR